MSLKVGDKVKIIDRISGHGFKIGEILTIKSVSKIDNVDRYYFENKNSGYPNYFAFRSEFEPIFTSYKPGRRLINESAIENL